MKDTRPSKVEHYLKIAKVIAERSPCSRKQFGAIIVKNGAIISTGYNGSARGTLNCGIEIPCLKDLYDEPNYVSYSKCAAVHAEENTIINAARSGISVLGGTLYLNTVKLGDGDHPCFRCRRYCINAGLKDCYYVDSLGQIKHEQVSSWVKLENDWMKKLLRGKKE